MLVGAGRAERSLNRADFAQGNVEVAGESACGLVERGRPRGAA